MPMFVETGGGDALLAFLVLSTVELTLLLDAAAASAFSLSLLALPDNR